VVIPRPGGLGGTTGGHGRGGGLPAGRGGTPVGGGLAGSRSGTPADGRGGGYTGSSSTALAPGRGKQTHVILDDEEVSFDEDEPAEVAAATFRRWVGGARRGGRDDGHD
jgi:hypothetical protein